MSTETESLCACSATAVTNSQQPRRGVVFVQSAEFAPHPTYASEPSGVDEVGKRKLTIIGLAGRELGNGKNESEMKKNRTLHALGNILHPGSERRKSMKMRNTVGNFFGVTTAMPENDGNECGSGGGAGDDNVSKSPNTTADDGIRGRGRKSKLLNGTPLTGSSSGAPIQKRPHSLSKGPRRGRERFRGVGAMFSTSAKRRGARPPGDKKQTGNAKRSFCDVEPVEEDNAVRRLFTSKRVVSPSPVRKDAPSFVDNCVKKFFSMDTSNRATRKNEN
jgi:hypothetical protein